MTFVMAVSVDRMVWIPYGELFSVLRQQPHAACGCCARRPQLQSREDSFCNCCVKNKEFVRKRTHTAPRVYVTFESRASKPVFEFSEFRFLAKHK
eukprot:SAG11_NODE_32203_length_285_cov_1.376344_1_plen_94_part_11